MFNPVHFGPGSAVVNALAPPDVTDVDVGAGGDTPASSSGETFLNPAQGSEVSVTVPGSSAGGPAPPPVSEMPVDLPALPSDLKSFGQGGAKGPVVLEGTDLEASSRSSMSDTDTTLRSVEPRVGTESSQSSAGRTSEYSYLPDSEDESALILPERGDEYGLDFASDVPSSVQPEVGGYVSDQPFVQEIDDPFSIGSETFGSQSDSSFGSRGGVTPGGQGDVELGPMGRRTAPSSVYDGDSFTGTPSFQDSDGVSINSELGGHGPMGAVDMQEITPFGGPSEVSELGYTLSLIHISEPTRPY